MLTAEDARELIRCEKNILEKPEKAFLAYIIEPKIREACRKGFNYIYIKENIPAKAFDNLINSGYQIDVYYKSIHECYYTIIW
jgi:hypothetical protein